LVRSFFSDHLLPPITLLPPHLPTPHHSQTTRTNPPTKILHLDDVDLPSPPLDTAGPSRLRAHIPVRTRSHDEASGNEAGGEETEWEGSVGDAAVVGSGGRRGVGRRTVSGPIAVAAGGDKRALRGRSQSLGGGGGGSVATVKAVMERKARFGDVESPAGLNLK